jgi:hypothetical protein
MRNLDLLKEAAALAGYTVVGSSQQIVDNKEKAQRRVNLVKADIIGRHGGKWDANYREGWLPLVPIYETGTADFTLDSRTVTGTGTTWTSAMAGRKMKGPDGAWYKISSVASATSIILSQPYQSATATGQVYVIWKDEYRLFPEVLTIGGFVNYNLETTLNEKWARDMKNMYPNPNGVQSSFLFTIVGRQPLTDAYTTGTITGTVNTRILTGSSTSWLANIEPGYQITIGSYKYTVKQVNSDTELELYQSLVVAVAALSTYSAVGKNALIVRFELPTIQKIMHYWYWAKDWPFVHDDDEDWIAENFPKVLQHGISQYDYLDKNDATRTQIAAQFYENAISDMRVAVEAGMTGVRTVGLDIPSSARE